MSCLGFAGMANWSVSIAPDTLKSRLQTGILHYRVLGSIVGIAMSNIHDLASIYYGSILECFGIK
jgi:hypothetical protein